MKYICLGYMDEKKWHEVTGDQATDLIDEIVAYDDKLRANGHFVGGEKLQSAHNAKTVRCRDSKAVVTDGPFIETKEQLGGIIVLEAPDIRRAIELMSAHPSVRMGGCWEIRPADDLTPMLEESRRRRDTAGGIT